MFWWFWGAKVSHWLAKYLANRAARFPELLLVLLWERWGKHFVILLIVSLTDSFKFGHWKLFMFNFWFDYWWQEFCVECKKSIKVYFLSGVEFLHYMSSLSPLFICHRLTLCHRQWCDAAMSQQKACDSLGASASTAAALANWWIGFLPSCLSSQQQHQLIFGSY